MKKEDFRGVIQHFHMKGVTPKQIEEELDSVHEESSPSYTTVKVWANEFKRGRTNLSNEPSTGRLKTAITLENIKKVHDEVTFDRRIKLHDLAEYLNLLKDSIGCILDGELNMKKLSARWVPRLLTLA